MKIFTPSRLALFGFALLALSSPSGAEAQKSPFSSCPKFIVDTQTKTYLPFSSYVGRKGFKCSRSKKQLEKAGYKLQETLTPIVVPKPIVPGPIVKDPIIIDIPQIDAPRIFTGVGSAVYEEAFRVLLSPRVFRGEVFGCKENTGVNFSVYSTDGTHSQGETAFESRPALFTVSHKSIYSIRITPQSTNSCQFRVTVR